MESDDSSRESDSSFDDNIAELDEMLVDLANIDEVDGVVNDSDNSDASSAASEQRRYRMRVNRDRLRPFYVNRKDILTLFDDEKVRKTFRFDKESIRFITGI